MLKRFGYLRWPAYLCRALVTFTLAALAVAVVPEADLSAQEPAPVPVLGARDLIFTDAEGSLLTARTPNEGRMHLMGSVYLSTADYFRGELDGVPEDLDDFALEPSFAAVFELQGDTEGALRGASLIFGSRNGLSDEDPFDNTSGPKAWYKSDNYVGVAARLSRDILAGATYTFYTVPNNIFDDQLQELALALGYAGPDFVGFFKPQTKLAIPTADGDGVYWEVSVNPEMILQAGGLEGVKVGVPVVFGAGFDDYYGDTDGTPMFVDLGFTASVPLGISKEFGNWQLTGGLHMMFREEDLPDLHPEDDAGNTVIYGRVGVTVTY